MKTIHKTTTPLFFGAALALSGCGVGTLVAPTPFAGPALRGNVHGGQQPVNGATIQLYAAGTKGYGSASRALIGSTVKTATDGSFNITGTYTCQPGDLVYLVATGGNPGVTGTNNNSAFAEMAGLGYCSALTPATYISVTEVTTVASVWALAPFMTSIANVGTTSTNVAGLTNAFNSIGVLASTATGVTPGPSLPAGATLPLAEINTLADILAACVNTVDTPPPVVQSSNCNAIFAAATSGNSVPTNTIQAALNIAHTPTLGLTTLNAMVSSVAPFQPILGAAPTSWTIAINYTAGGLNQPSAIAADPSGSIWATNLSSNTVTKLAAGTGAPVATNGFNPGNALSAPSGLALDTAGNAWIANKGSNSVVRVAANGSAATTYTGGGLSQPNAIAIDAAGNIWTTNSANNTVSEFTNAGRAISPAAGFSTPAVNGTTPTAIAINSK